MKLEVKQTGAHNKHEDVASCVGWSPQGVFFSASDDHRINSWNSSFDEPTKLTELPEALFPTAMAIANTQSKKGKAQAGTAVVACDTGKFLVISLTSGRVEKKVEAHKGAITACRWSPDGQSIMTGGEDGQVKVWSRSGMLRSTLTQSTSPIYDACWSSNGEKVIHTSGKHVAVVSLKAHTKAETWAAHEGVVLCVDWSVNDTIVTGGEDRRYKVWDAFGTLLYASGQDAHPVTCARWAHSGDLFLVGGFNSARLCDKSGWTHALEKPAVGSIYDIAWDADDSKVGCACSSGDVLLAQIIERSVQSEYFTVTQTSDNTLIARSVKDNNDDELEFREAVKAMYLSHGYLVVATATQCLIYKEGSWVAPATINLKSSIATIAQAAENLLIVDESGALQVYGYDGRLVSTLRVKVSMDAPLTANAVSLSKDTIVMIDRKDSRLVRVYDLQSGKEMGEPLQHSVEVINVALDQNGDTLERMLAFTDKTHDLYMVEARRSSRRSAKIATAVTQMMWHEQYHILLTLQDAKVLLWFFPSCVFIDEALLSATRIEPSSGATVGKAPSLLLCASTTSVIRRADGAIVNLAMPPYLTLLHAHVEARRWQDAIRLCRFVKNSSLWTTLGVMATKHKELTSAEIAFAAVNIVDKVEFLQAVKRIPTAEGRDAELALFTGQIDEAASILLKSGLTYRLIDMYTRLHMWPTALETAIRQKTHVDTVLGRRQRYLESLGQTETNDTFLQYGASVEIKWDDIDAKVAMEAETEARRPGAKPFES